MGGNSPIPGEFLAQMGSNAEMFSFDDVIMELRCGDWTNMTGWYNIKPNNGHQAICSFAYREVLYIVRTFRR